MTLFVDRSGEGWFFLGQLHGDCRCRQEEKHGDPETAGQSGKLKNDPRQDCANQATGSVRHIIEADIHRDLVFMCISQNQVAVYRRVDGEKQAEQRETADDRQSGVEV